ncbi:MAG: class I SAM-dependent methyltransferase [Chitinophagales bacterium]|nr:class I SAM-dependent methyltransferase [Chitinophagales bacterium]
MNFKDYFSTQAIDYAKYRPDYPAALFDFIFSKVHHQGKAWDCATGNGQVAIKLAERFEQVVATDASEKQIASAMAYKNVTYQVVAAEQSGFADELFDLITVGQALHWFHFDQFFTEVKRVAKPGCFFIAFGYGDNFIEPNIDKVVQWFSNDLLGGYWPKERQYIDDSYLTIPFPFKQVEMPAMYISKNWDLADLMGYFSTWSSTNLYIKQNGSNPLQLLSPRLLDVWGEPTQKRLVQWPLFALAAYV